MSEHTEETVEKTETHVETPALQDPKEEHRVPDVAPNTTVVETTEKTVKDVDDA